MLRVMPDDAVTILRTVSQERKKGVLHVLQVLLGSDGEYAFRAFDGSAFDLPSGPEDASSSSWVPLGPTWADAVPWLQRRSADLVLDVNEAWQARVTSVLGTVIPVPWELRHGTRYVLGDDHDGLVLWTEFEAIDRAQLQYALMVSRTWGDFRQHAPSDDYDQLVEWALDEYASGTDEDVPDDWEPDEDEPFEVSYRGEGVWPVPGFLSLGDLLPWPLLLMFGKYMEPRMDPSYWMVEEGLAEVVHAELAARGHDVRVDEELVGAAAGLLDPEKTLEVIHERYERLRRG